MQRLLRSTSYFIAVASVAWLVPWALAAPVGTQDQGCREVSITEIQGAGVGSPLAGGPEPLCATACVTGVGAEGFFVQNVAPDGNPQTSEGVYVYRYGRWQNPRRLKAGDLIHLSNFRVQEFYGQTEVVKLADDKSRSYQHLGSCPLPPPVPVALPTDPEADLQDLYERYEGMRVSLSLDASVTGPTRRYPSRFTAGEPEITVVDRGSPFYGRRILAANAPPGRAALGLSGGLGQDLPDVGTLDRIRAEALTAILAFQFGRYVLLIEDAAPLRVEPAGQLREMEPPTGDDDFSVCTYNAENLFDPVDDGDGDAGDWSPPDPLAYRRRVAKQAEVIAKGLGGCTLVGLQEVEGKDAVWEELAHAAGAPYRYDYWESQDVRDITQGVLYDATRVELWSSRAVQACSSKDYGVDYTTTLGVRSSGNPCSQGQYPLYDRPPYVADVAVRNTSGDRAMDVRVVVVHLKSKRGDEAENEPRRLMQAQHVASLMDRPRTIVLGDLNDGLGSPVARQFAGSINLYERHVAPASRYSYIYQGRAEAIDHIIFDRELERFFFQGGPVHLNADWPEAQNEEPAQSRVSDHDPLIARFAFHPTGVGAAFDGALAGGALIYHSHFLRRK